MEQWDERRASDPDGTAAAASLSMAKHVEYLLRFKRMGLPVFDYGNNIRQVALDAGVAKAFDIPGFVPEYIRPLFCRGIGPFRWVALSGDPEDIYKTDAKVKELIPDDPHLHHWLDMARSQNSLSRIAGAHLLGGPGSAASIGPGVQRHGEDAARLSAPIVIGRDHLDSGSVASPNRETEAMQDGSDAVSDWPLLNALLNTASGATWVSIHHGGGVGMGYSQHAGVVIVCDGSEAAAKRIRRVLWNDPGTGVMRHADAGYEDRHRLRSRTGSETADDRAALSGQHPGSARRHAVAGDVAAYLRATDGAAAVRRRIAPRIRTASALVDKIVASGDAAYGINTGFGLLAQTRIPNEQLELLQRNLLLSHAAGVGEALPDAVVRLILVLKINALARGHSGITMAADRRPAAPCSSTRSTP